MILRYDRDADALYITLIEGRDVARTEELDRGTLVDVDRHGQAIGIEVLRPSREWPIDHVVSRYGLGPEVAELLRGLWGTRPGERPFPYQPERTPVSA